MPKPTEKTITITIDKAVLGFIASRMYGENPTPRKPTEVLRDVVYQYGHTLPGLMTNDIQEDSEKFVSYFDNLTDF